MAFSVLECFAICGNLFKVYHSSCEWQKCKIVNNLYCLGVKVDAFLEIGLNFRYDVAFYTGLGIDFHGFDSVPRFNDAVYGFLSRLKTGIAKDEQVAGGL